MSPRGTHGAFVVRLYGDRSNFRTVVLHELAHIQCGDVGKTYLAIATCLAFLLAAVVPALSLVFLAGPGWFDIVELSFSITMWITLVALSGASVLRAREYYADVQTSAWEGTPSNLVQILAGSSRSSVQGWRGYLHLHPALGERRAAVADPSILFGRVHGMPWQSGSLLG